MKRLLDYLAIVIVAAIYLAVATLAFLAFTGLIIHEPETAAGCTAITAVVVLFIWSMHRLENR